MNNADTALLHNYLPWSAVKTFLHLNEESCRQQVRYHNIPRIPNPYAQNTYLYERKALKALKLRRIAYQKSHPNLYKTAPAKPEV